MEWNFRQLHRSRRDVWLSGVCGGLGEHTPLPSWLWRVIFVATTTDVGAGVEMRTALTNDDLAGVNQLTAEALHAETL